MTVKNRRMCLPSPGIRLSRDGSSGTGTTMPRAPAGHGGAASIKGDPTMPLHERETIVDRLEDCIFAGHSLMLPIPKYRFPEDEMAPKAAFQVISDELILDGNARQNLATFCQTWAEPELLALMELSFNKNMMDKDEYPQTAEIERRCVHMLAGLWHAPRRGQHGRRLGHRLVGGLHAGRPGGQVAVAG
jgi:hypothetical protein